MPGETVLRYNGVELSYIDTASADTEAVRDQSGMDHLYDRHTIRVAAVMAFLPGQPVPPALPGEVPAQTMARVEHMLSVPRRPLLYAVDGVPLYQSDGLDPAGGPFPAGPPKITKVTPNSFLIEYTVVLCTNACPDQVLVKPPQPKAGKSPDKGTRGAGGGGGGQGANNKPAIPVPVGNRPFWSSLRWSQQQDIDEYGYSTITTTGRVIFNADVIRQLKTPDDLRGILVPGVPNNFVRKSHYTLQADGLAMDFVHVDAEVYQMPPEDAVKLTGSFVHRFVKAGGKWLAHVNLRLEGRKDVPKPRLMATAISIAFNRLKKADIKVAKENKQPIILEGKFQEVFDRNAVEVELAAQTEPPQTEVKRALDFGDAGVAAAILGTAPVVGPVLANVYLAGVVNAQVQQAKDAANRQAKLNHAGGPGVLPMNLDQWGSPLLGCPSPTEAAGGIAPELYGNFPQLRLVAAAFRDPCLTNTLDMAAQVAMDESTLKPSPLTPPIGGSSFPPTVTYPSISQVTVLNALPPVRPVALRSVYDPYQGVYESYTIQCLYNRKEHNHLLPATVSGQTEKEVRVANPSIRLICQWTASKYGTAPTVPDPAPKDTNTVYLGGGNEVSDAQLTGDGGHLLYTIHGEYIYGFKDYARVNLNFPVVPWLNVDSRMLSQTPTDPDVIFGNTGSPGIT